MFLKAVFFVLNSSIDIKILDVSKFLLEELSLKIGRLALVKNFFIEDNVSAIQNLLCEDKKSLLLKEITIRINEEKTIGEKKCNNIEILSNGIFENKKTKEKKIGIVVNRDINTLLEELQSNSFTPETASQILKDFDVESEKLTLLK